MWALSGFSRPTSDHRHRVRHPEGERALMLAAVTLGRWRHRLRWVAHKLNAGPLPFRIIAIGIIVLVRLTSISLIYHMVRKPSELLSLVGG